MGALRIALGLYAYLDRLALLEIPRFAPHRHHAIGIGVSRLGGVVAPEKGLGGVLERRDQ